MSSICVLLNLEKAISNSGLDVTLKMTAYNICMVWQRWGWGFSVRRC